MDGHKVTGNGWEALAPYLGLYQTIIRMAIKNQEHNISPSVLVLDNYFMSHKGYNRCETLQILSNFLRVIHNLDAKDLVEEQIAKMVGDDQCIVCEAIPVLKL